MKPGRKPIDDSKKVKHPIYVSDWTKSQLDGLFGPNRKTYDSIIRSLLHARRSFVGVSKSAAARSEEGK